MASAWHAVSWGPANPGRAVPAAASLGLGRASLLGVCGPVPASGPGNRGAPRQGSQAKDLLSPKLLSSLSDSQGEVTFLHAQPQIKVLLLFPLCSCASPYLTHCPSSVFAVPSITPSTDHIPLGPAPRSEDNLISRCSCSFFNLSNSLLTLLSLEMPSTVGSCKWQKKADVKQTFFRKFSPC